MADDWGNKFFDDLEKHERGPGRVEPLVNCERLSLREVVMEVWDKVKKDVLWFILLVFLLYIVGDALPFARDTTDQKGWFADRSQMRLHTDELTGCQYLSVPGGGITPRLDRNGKIMYLVR